MLFMLLLLGMYFDTCPCIAHMQIYNKIRLQRQNNRNKSTRVHIPRHCYIGKLMLILIRIVLWIETNIFRSTCHRLENRMNVCCLYRFFSPLLARGSFFVLFFSIIFSFALFFCFSFLLCWFHWIRKYSRQNKNKKKFRKTFFY